jgi:hypothetical protein
MSNKVEDSTGSQWHGVVPELPSFKRRSPLVEVLRDLLGMRHPVCRFPGLISGGVTAPQVGHDFAIEAYVKCATVAMRRRQGLRERFTQWLESGGHRTVDFLIRKTHELIKNPAKHPCPAADALSNAGSNQTASAQRSWQC